MNITEDTWHLWPIHLFEKRTVGLVGFCLYRRHMYKVKIGLRALMFLL